MKQEKNNFLLYKDYKEHIELLSDEEAGKLFKAIFRYVDGREETKLQGGTAMAFSFIKANLERDLSKYKERLKIAQENGKKGGRPKETKRNPKKPKETNGFSKKPKKGVIVIDNVNVIVNDIDIDIVIVKEYTNDLALTKSIVDFINHRYSMPKKDRLTNLGLTKFLNLLDKYFDDSISDKITAIDKSIASGWKTVYEPNNQGKQKPVKSFMDL